MKGNRQKQRELEQQYAHEAGQVLGYTVAVSIRPASMLSAIGGKKWVALVSDLFGQTPAAVCGKSRNMALVRTRQLICHTLYQHSELSLPQIGELLNRDHTTVLYNIETSHKMLKTADSFFMDGYLLVYNAMKAIDEDN